MSELQADIHGGEMMIAETQRDSISRWNTNLAAIARIDEKNGDNSFNKRKREQSNLPQASF